MFLLTSLTLTTKVYIVTAQLREELSQRRAELGFLGGFFAEGNSSSLMPVFDINMKHIGGR